MKISRLLLCLSVCVVGCTGSDADSDLSNTYITDQISSEEDLNAYVSESVQLAGSALDNLSAEDFDTHYFPEGFSVGSISQDLKFDGTKTWIRTSAAMRAGLSLDDYVKKAKASKSFLIIDDERNNDRSKLVSDDSDFPNSEVELEDRSFAADEVEIEIIERIDSDQIDQLQILKPLISQPLAPSGGSLVSQYSGTREFSRSAVEVGWVLKYDLEPTVLRNEVIDTLGGFAFEMPSQGSSSSDLVPADESKLGPVGYAGNINEELEYSIVYFVNLHNQENVSFDEFDYNDEGATYLWIIIRTVPSDIFAQ